MKNWQMLFIISTIYNATGDLALGFVGLVAGLVAFVYER